MKKFKFAALALVGVGALGCSGHKITMKPIEKAEDALARLEGIAEYEGEYELPESFKFTFSYTMTEKNFYKDTQTVLETETMSNSLEFLYDFKNLRGFYTTTETKEIKAGASSKSETIVERTYMFFKDKAIHTVTDEELPGYLEEEEPNPATEEEAKTVMKKRGAYILSESTGLAAEFAGLFVMFDMGKEELGEDAVINNKYGSDDEKSFQILSNCKFKIEEAPNFTAPIPKIKGDIVADVFGEIKNYYLTNCDLSLNAKADYSEEEAKIEGTREMSLKANGKFEEGKGGFSIPTYAEYVAPEVR